MSDATNDAPSAYFHPCPHDEQCGYCNGSVPAEERLDWSFLDAAFCICLQSRDDRAEQAAEEFHRVGLCQLVQFYRPLKHPTKGLAGSWESHRAVATRAMEEGFERTLVCEDDVLFVGNLTQARIKRIGTDMDALPEDWMIFHLGHWPLRAYFHKRRILKTMSACAHAYVESARLAKWLHERPYGTQVPMHGIIGNTLDSAFARLPGVFATFPMIAIQRVSTSDNFAGSSRPKKELKHYVTRSKHREWLLSNLMRPAQAYAVALSPLWWAKAKLSGNSDEPVEK